MPSNNRLSRWSLLVPVTLLLPLALACQRASGPERVEELRSHYEVRLNGFVVRDAPLGAPLAAAIPDPDATPWPAVAEPGAPAAPGPADVAGTAPGEAEAPFFVEGEDLPPSPRDVVLDLLVHHRAPENLPGITVDVSQAGPDEVEKAHFRIWVPTARISRGQNAQVSHVLEGVDFAPGDRFAVEVVSPVPADQRGEYREFEAQ
jgi:hypothetical protein